MTNYKQLCAELANELDHNRQCLLDDRRLTHPLADKARAALAEPEPEGPTDEELLEMMPQPFRDDLALVSRMAAHGAGPDIKPGLFRVSLNTGALDYARAVLARWGNHPALQPISVTERLPGPGDCDGNGKCWAWKLDDEDDAWHLELQEWINSPWTTHWLPAHALPVPSHD